MKRKLFLIIFTFFVGGVGWWVMIRYVFPYLSTLPLLRNWELLRPAAPIVINRREEVRISEGINHVEVANRVKNSLATVYVHEGNFGGPKFRMVRVLTGTIVSSDGLIVFPAANLVHGFAITVIYGDETYPGDLLDRDGFHGLAFVKIQAVDLPVVKQGFARETQIGEKLVMVRGTENPGLVAIKTATLVKRSIPDVSIVKVYNFLEPNVLLATDLVPLPEDLGALLVNKDASLIGMVTQLGDNLVVLRSEDMQAAVNNYLSDKKIEWPQLNILYQIFGPAQTGLFNLSHRHGIIIKTAFAPFKENDFVFAVDGQELTLEDGFQSHLLGKNPGEKAILKIIREGKEQEITLNL